MLDHTAALSILKRCLAHVTGQPAAPRDDQTLDELGVTDNDRLVGLKDALSLNLEVGVKKDGYYISYFALDSVTPSTTVSQLVTLLSELTVPVRQEKSAEGSDPSSYVKNMLTGGNVRTKDARGTSTSDDEPWMGRRGGAESSGRGSAASRGVGAVRRSGPGGAKRGGTKGVAAKKGSKGGAKKAGASKKGAGRERVAPRPAAAVGGEAARAEGEKVLCHFRAEMEGEVMAGRVTTIEFVVSREEIGRATGAAAGEAEAAVEREKNLIVQVIPRVNFETVGDSRAEVPVPEPGGPLTLYFDVRPTHPDDGEVRVVVRQGQIPYATLTLRPRVVKAKGARAGRVGDEKSVAPVATSLPEPPHVLRIYEQTNGSQSSFVYELQSRSLDEFSTYRSEPFAGDRQKYVESLYKQIEERWLSSGDDREAFAAELRAFGGQLFSQLFPAELQRILWEHRATVRNIMVVSEEPFIPWELVHLREPGEAGMPEETIFLGQMGLVRWLHNAGIFPDTIKLRRGRALYVIPRYPDPRIRLPQAELEARFLKEQFDAEAVEPQPAPVRQLISRPGHFDLLHFACHGEAEQDNISNARLLLEGRVEDGRYVPDSLSSTTVASYCNLKGEGNRPMVVLNACQIGREGYSLTGTGGFAEAFLRGGAGVFVGTLWAVGDSPARTFTETFYREFAGGAPVAEAAVRAREAARAAGDATWLAYAIYAHPFLKVVN